MNAELLAGKLPPFGQRSEGVTWGSRTRDRSIACSVPVDLWRNIVDGAFAHPGDHIGEKSVVLPVGRGSSSSVVSIRKIACLAGRGKRDAFKAVLLADAHPGGTGRTDAEFDVGFDGVGDFVNHSHHGVDILTTPVAYRHRAALINIGLIIAPVVGGIVLGNIVGIEIVVKHKSVDIVIAGDNGTYALQTRRCPRVAGVECEFSHIILK